MAEWKKVGVQTVSYIIASGLILSGFNIFYNDFYNKPHIDTQWIQSKDKPSAEVTVKNDGRVTATNLLLTFQIPEDMAKYPPTVFSTINITNITS